MFTGCEFSSFGDYYDFQVQIIDLEGKQYNADDVLIMGTDGLWDVITNLRAVEIVRSAIASVSKDNKDR